MTVRIVVIDQTNDPTVAAVLPAIEAAIQQQVNTSFNAAWCFADVQVTGCMAEGPGPNDWPCYVQETLDDPEALAYHTTENGEPVLRVGWGVIRDNGGTLTKGAVSLSVAMSHEVLETLADAFCDFYSDARKNGTADVALEVCDPVQSSCYEQDGDGIAVSNFVTPEWFRDGPSVEGFDHLGLLTSPRTILQGGYLAFEDGSTVFGAEVPEWKKDQVKKCGRRVRHP